MSIDEWKQLAMQYFKSGIATDEHWEVMAACLLRASEAEGLDSELDKAIESHDAPKLPDQPDRCFDVESFIDRVEMWLGSANVSIDKEDVIKLAREYQGYIKREISKAEIKAAADAIMNAHCQWHICPKCNGMGNCLYCINQGGCKVTSWENAAIACAQAWGLEAIRKVALS